MQTRPELAPKGPRPSQHRLPLAQIRSRLARIPWFLILLPLFFVLHGWKENVHDLRASEVLGLAGVYLFAALILWLLSRILIKNRGHAALFAFLLLAVNFFFGPVQDLLAGSRFPWISSYRLMLPLIGIMLALLIFALRRNRTRKFQQLARYLGFLLLILIAMDVVSIASMLTGKREGASRPTTDDPDFRLFSLADSVVKPDIYLLLCDEFASSRSLLETWGFDNTDFDTALTRRGFRVMADSRSNYNFTPFSVASILQMNYPEFTGNASEVSMQDYSNIHSMIGKNRLSEVLRANGYRIHNYSIFDLPGEPAILDQAFLPLHTRLITSQTLLSRLRNDLGHLLVTGRFRVKALAPFFQKQEAGNNEKVIMQTIRDAGESPAQPRFFYLHLFLPHLPYLFDSLGNRRDATLFERDYRENPAPEYFSSVRYADRRLLSLTDSILARSARPPVIVLMGDHGFRKQHPDTNVLDYFRNMNAVYLPSGEYALFPDSISAVNQFRLILNTVFGKTIPLLPDSTIFLTDKGQHVPRGSIK